jgi:hypothetical protein
VLRVIPVRRELPVRLVRLGHMGCKATPDPLEMTELMEPMELMEPTALLPMR